jgi:hypothetical protein
VLVFLVVSFPLASLPVTYTRFSSPPRGYTTRPPHLPRLDNSNYTDGDYKSCISSPCSFLHPCATPSLFGPNILFSTLLSNTLSLCRSLNIRDHGSHPYRTTGTITVLYIQNFTFFYSRREDKRFWAAPAALLRGKETPLPIGQDAD